MSNATPTAITNINIKIAGNKLKFDTPYVEIYEKHIDYINVVIHTCINHLIFESSFSLFFFINYFSLFLDYIYFSTL